MAVVQGMMQAFDKISSTVRRELDPATDGAF